LIQASIKTLQRDLLEEAIIVSFVTIAFLFHFRSALIPILALPVAVLASFIPMHFLHVSSNIMSLGGLALAIGVLIDASIVMVENGYRHLSERIATTGASGTELTEKERRRILMGGAKQVGPAIFFSLLVIVVSFLPVFLLEAQEGRMFRPLAWTKTTLIEATKMAPRNFQVLETSTRSISKESRSSARTSALSVFPQAHHRFAAQSQQRD